MTGTTWQRRLDMARTVTDVVGVARDFLASFDPPELHALPTPCAPPAKLIDGDDIASYAFDLLRYECEAPGTADLVHRLARFFSHASIRLAQLTAHSARDADEADRPAVTKQSA
jgi:hypothetical protein